MLMLLAVAATINAMAVTYTAKAKVTLSSGSGYFFDLMLSESAEYGALTGSVMYEDGEQPYIALYVIKGSEKLQIARSSNLDDVKVGLKTNGSTSYTITVSEVAGDLLYLYDKEELTGYALTDGASYTFEAPASSTITDRFYLTKTLPDLGQLETCFTGTVLQINNNPYPGAIHVKWYNGSTNKDESIDRETSSIDFTNSKFKSSTSTTVYTIEFGKGDSKHAFNVTVTH
jgi:hypothetical protein